MKTFRLSLCFLFFLGILNLNAQTKSELQIGFAQPLGDFADDDYNNAIMSGSGAAASGFYLGYKSLTPLGSKELFWTISAGIMYNALNSDFQSDTEDELKASEIYTSGLESSFSKYVNIPILVGLQYETVIFSKTKLFGEVGIGINYLNMSKMSFSWDYYESGHTYDCGLTMTFKPSIQLGYKLGGGILINDKYSIGISYLGLGSHKLKYVASNSIDGESDESDEARFDPALSISSLNLSLGIRF